ncbi:hypothetical protein D9615_010655 [Tricholomella constricta]|uniref:Uncharacterized protein n=1 Tax=Tricholomella constricta TaxID=117010 RepID=A0A8H5GJ41_9AGAR|nr:hypothetical protein D9615_010655 [Tricholomella constricta]
MHSVIHSLVIFLRAMQEQDPLPSTPVLMPCKIPFDDPDVLNQVRIAYDTAQPSFLACTTLFLSRSVPRPRLAPRLSRLCPDMVQERSDRFELHRGSRSHAHLKSSEPGILVITTIHDHGLSDTLNSSAPPTMGIAMMVSMRLHLKYKPLALMGFEDL